MQPYPLPDKYKAMKYYTAIIFNKNFDTGEIIARKYRNIKDNPASIDRFIKFAQRTGASEINLYNKKTRKFERKIKIGTDTPPKK